MCVAFIICIHSLGLTLCKGANRSNMATLLSATIYDIKLQECYAFDCLCISYCSCPKQAAVWPLLMRILLYLSFIFLKHLSSKGLLGLGARDRVHPGQDSNLSQGKHWKTNNLSHTHTHTHSQFGITNYSNENVFGHWKGSGLHRKPMWAISAKHCNTQA